jgi:hypothetical protein
LNRYSFVRRAAEGALISGRTGIGKRSQRLWALRRAGSLVRLLARLLTFGLEAALVIGGYLLGGD